MSVLFLNCTQDELKPDRVLDEDELNGEVFDPYAGGVRIENPYDIRNMKMALDTIKAKLARGEYTFGDPNETNQDQQRATSIFEQYNVSISHKYIKFSPQNENEVAILKQDSTLTVVDYPLDVEFPDTYFDNRITPSDNYIPQYYTTIAVGTTIPNVSHEILGDLYIPEEDAYFNVDNQPFTRETQITNEEDILHHILYEAYALKGKEDELLADNGFLPGANGSRFLIFGRQWNPSGTIQVFDERGGETPGGTDCYTVTTADYTNCELILQAGESIPDDSCIEYITTTICDNLPGTQGRFVPVAGAQVLMRQFFTVRQSITSADGTFTTGTVRGRARYIIQWERYHYSIRDGLVFQAELRGPRVRDSDWNKNIASQEDQYHAMIHIGAHEYYYGDRQGTHTPPRNGPGKQQMKIAATEIDGASSHIPFLTFFTQGLIPQVMIKSWGEPTDEVFGTTVHELAHAAHRNLDFIGYNSLVFRGYTLPCATGGPCNNPTNSDHRSARRLMETWAQTIETEFVLERYRNLPDGEGSNYNYINFNYQNVPIIQDQFYTSGGIDMIDDFNQRSEFNNSALPIDNVDGYTLEQLEDALVGANTWLQWRLQLADLFDNPTESNLRQLFNNWN